MKAFPFCLIRCCRWWAYAFWEGSEATAYSLVIIVICYATARSLSCLLVLASTVMVTFSLIIKYSYGRQGRNTGMSGRSLPSPAYWTKLAWKLTFRNEQLYYHFYPLASSTKVATAAAPSKYFRNCVFPWFGVVDFSESILMERCVWRVQLYRSKSCLRKLINDLWLSVSSGLPIHPLGRFEECEANCRFITIYWLDISKALSATSRLKCVPSLSCSVAYCLWQVVANCSLPDKQIGLNLR